MDKDRGDAPAFDEEVRKGQRFQFGDNWREFLKQLDDSRIAEAERSLREMLDVEDLRGRRFVDVGSGSGLFSLAARRLGATVHSFDYDPSSVGCTQELKRRYFPDDANWSVERGSALDASYLDSLGTFDVVYSWGVLHHTGDMWKALDLVARLVRPDGRLFIALYNDQGRMSRYWTAVKKSYCRLPPALKPLVLYPAFVQIWGPRTLLEIAQLRPFHTWKTYSRKRGMSPWRDLVDWVGGYPFEVSRPEQIFAFYRERGFTLEKLKTTTGSGINQFVFVRRAG